MDGNERDFYIRQLRDWKGSADIEAMVPAGMKIYAQMCGWTLARAHARSGDAVAIAAYLGKGDVFDRAIAAFSAAYADRNDADYALLKERRRQRTPGGAHRAVRARLSRRGAPTAAGPRPSPGRS